MITNCLEVEAGSYINPENGKIEKEQPFYMASHMLYHAAKGDRVEVNDWAFLLAVANIIPKYQKNTCILICMKRNRTGAGIVVI